jgi:curved DNA-binding protein CbpA
MADPLQWEDLEHNEIYTLLEIHPESTLTQIKTAYKRKALHYHPDKCTDPQAITKFLLLSKAIGILSCPQSRSNYNARLQKWKDKKRREAEMDSTRRIMRKRLEEREAVRPDPKQSYTTTTHQTQNHEFKTYQSSSIIAKSITRDELLDFLAPFGEVIKFFQIAPGCFQFSFASPQQEIAFQDQCKKSNFKGTFQFQQPTPQQRLTQQPSSFDLSLQEFLAFEQQILGNAL